MQVLKPICIGAEKGEKGRKREILGVVVLHLFTARSEMVKHKRTYYDNY